MMEEKRGPETSRRDREVEEKLGPEATSPSCARHAGMQDKQDLFVVPTRTELKRNDPRAQTKRIQVIKHESRNSLFFLFIFFLPFSNYFYPRSTFGWQYDPFLSFAFASSESRARANTRTRASITTYACPHRPQPAAARELPEVVTADTDHSHYDVKEPHC